MARQRFFRSRWGWAVAAAGLLCLGWVQSGSAGLAEIGVGEAAPDFDLVDLDGARHNLLGERGEVVLLYFFGHNAPVCYDPARSIEQDLMTAYESKGFTALGIDCWNGTREQVDQFRRETGVSFPLLLSGNEAGSVYDLSYNSVVVIDGRGYVRYVSAGPSPSAYSQSELRTVIERLLEEANATREATWGAIKSLYTRKKMAV